MSRRLAVTFVIMAGGKGERLWPLVRTTMPKVCLSPDGTQTLLHATIDRLKAAWPTADWLIVTTKGQAGPIRAALPRALRDAVIVEPQIKNTAACITLAAVAVAMRNPHQVMVVVPADHWIDDVGAFQQAVRAAIRYAVAEDTIAMIGIRPTHPHPGLGYLRAGTLLPGSASPRVFHLARFIEKPTSALAHTLVQEPRTYWNSGIFVGQADKFLECVTEWLPEHTKRLVPLASGLHPQPRARRMAGMTTLMRRARSAYRALEAVSFDHGVMDHLNGGVVVEGRFSWADLGSWDTWARLGQASRKTIAVESPNVTVVGAGDHLVATIGVRDLLIVHTPTATLICHPERAQAVREIVKRLDADARYTKYR